MTVSTPLTKELVGNPTYCRLDIRIGTRSLDVMVYNPLEDNSLLLRHVELSSDSAEGLKQIETFIYDNPLLLSEFKVVTALVESRKFLVVPTALSESCDSIKLLQEADSDTDARAVVIEDNLDEFEARILTPVEASIINFLRRTFPNIRLHNTLYPFTRYCHANLTKGNTSKAFVDIREKSLDIVVMNSNALELVNRFEYREISDAVFYILKCTENEEIAEILIGGNREQRDLLMPELRKFRPYVMPMIFPSAMFKAGAESMKAPFDLIILPLCE